MSTPRPLTPEELAANPSGECTRCARLLAALEAARVYVAALEAEVAEEREACARLAENPYSDEVDGRGYDQPLVTGANIAAAIRARGTEKRHA